MSLLANPQVISWLKGDLSFLSSKSLTKSKLYKLENDWAWDVFCKARPMHGYKQDGTWSGKLTEMIVSEIIPNGWKPSKVEKFQLDWEDDNFIYEVKTQFHMSTGDAHEKIGATPIKYRGVPCVTKKRLKIICLAGTETHWKKIFNEKECGMSRQLLDLWESWGIDFVWGSDLLKRNGL